MGQKNTMSLKTFSKLLHVDGTENHLLQQEDDKDVAVTKAAIDNDETDIGNPCDDYMVMDSQRIGHDFWKVR